MSIRDLPDSPPVFGHHWNTLSRPFPPPPEALAEPAFVPRHHAPRQPEEPFAGMFAEREQQAEAARVYRVHAEATWRAAREDYEIGYTAEAICKQYDLGLSAFRQRARREGWRREDGAAEEPVPLSLAEEAQAGPPTAPPTAELADIAWRSGAQAIARGEVYKARAWFRLAGELREADKEERKRLRWAEHDALEALAATPASPR